MSRSIAVFAFVLLFGACDQERNQTPKLEPVHVDQAAAFPEQKPGTRPPVLTGGQQLTQEQLDEGWVQLFDGISTYGWEVKEGDANLIIAKQDKSNGLFCNKKSDGRVVVEHRVAKNQLCFEDDHMGSGGSGGFETYVHAAGINMNDDLNPSHVANGISESRGKPINMQPQTEADWRPVSGASKAVWTDGELELSGGSGWLESVREYGDFVLQLEYLTEKPEEGKAGVNSGVFFRCIPGEKMNGYECQIFNNPPASDYDKYIGTDTGGIFRRCVGRNLGPKDGEWNYLTVAARGPMIATWVNGIQAVDWTDTRAEHDNPRNGLRLKPGTIQLQGHDPETKIRFRNFRIAELKTDH